MSKPTGYSTFLALFAHGPIRKDTRSLGTMMRSTAEPMNGRPEVIPYVYRGNPPSHPGLCDGCGMLNARCRCEKIG